MWTQGGDIVTIATLCTYHLSPPPYQTCGYWMWTQGGGIVTILLRSSRLAFKARGLGDRPPSGDLPQVPLQHHAPTIFLSYSYQTCGYWMWTQGGGIVTIATLCTLFPIRHVAIGCGLREVELTVSMKYYTKIL